MVKNTPRLAIIVLMARIALFRLGRKDVVTTVPMLRGTAGDNGKWVVYLVKTASLTFQGVRYRRPACRAWVGVRDGSSGPPVVGDPSIEPWSNSNLAYGSACLLPVLGLGLGLVHCRIRLSLRVRVRVQGEGIPS